MADQEWSKNAIFDPALVRRMVEEQVHVERPINIETAHAKSPPVPGQDALERHAVLADPHAVLADPQVVEFWQQIAAGAPPDATQPVPPPDDAATLAQLSMALYLLQAVHSQDKPGHSHLSRDENSRPDSEEDEDPDAEPV